MGLSAQDKDRIFGRIGLIIGGIPVLGVSLMVVDIMRHKGVISFPVAMILMLIVGGAEIWGFVKLFLLTGGRPKNESLLRDGVPAAALVLQKSDTGYTVGTQIKVELLLEVKIPLPDRPVYQTKIKTWIPRLQPDLFAPGTVLEVRVDANDPKSVAIVRIVSDEEIVRIASDEEEAHGSDQLASKPEKSRKKSNPRKGRRSTYESQ